MASRTHLGERAAAGDTTRQPDRLAAGRARRMVQALALHEHRTAAALLGLLVLVYLWPALVGGALLAPLAMLYDVAPWQERAPAGIEQFINFQIGDVPLSYYPWNVLARELIHAGTFPAWNPHAFAGTPFFANIQLAWLSPFSLPLWIFPLNYGLGVAAALKLWVAGFGTYLLARELRLGFWPGLVAGIAFALCAFNVVWLTHGVQVSVAALLPWSVLLTERLVRRGRGRDGLLLALVVAVALSGGHPGTQLHLLAGMVLYALLRAAVSSDLATRERVRRLAIVGAAVIVGALLVAVVIVPAQRATSGAAGVGARTAADAFEGYEMSPEALRTALFPDWWGRPSEHQELGPVNYRERTFYVGSLVLLLAVTALLASGGWRRKAPLAVLGALGAAIAVKAPGLFDLVARAPLFEQVQNQRALLWSQFAVAVLSAFGLQALLDAPRRQRRAWGALALGLLAALLALASLEIDGDTVADGLEYLARRSPDLAPTDAVLALASVGWWLVFLAAAAALLLVARRWPARRWLIGLLAVLIVAADMLHFADGYQPMGPPSQVIPPRTPAIAFLQRHVDDGRMVGYEFMLPNDWTTVYGLRDARGYDPPQPSLRYARLWRTVKPNQRYVTTFTINEATTPALRVLGLLGVRYIVLGPGGTGESPHLSFAYEGTDATILANDLAMPRAIVAERVHVAANEAQEMSTAINRLDPRRDAIVRRDELGSTPLPLTGGAGTVRVVDEQNARVTLRATLPRTGLVVLGDAWAPGWSVRVDGRPARALQADVVLRGVVVPAGSHTIEWSYRVPGLRTGALLSALGLASVLGWAGVLVVRSRRRGRAAAPVR
jgi:Bacterial membrane protein YfhO